MASVQGSAPKIPTRSEVARGSSPWRSNSSASVQHVGRRHHDDVRTEVVDQLHLPLGLPPDIGTTVQPEPLGAVMRAEPAGEQAVAVGDVHHIARPAARGADRARHQRRPGRCRARCSPPPSAAGGATGGVQARDLAARHREQAERVVLAQVLLDREGEVPEVLKRPQVLRMHAGALALGAVGSDALVGVVEDVLQARELQRTQFILARAFDRLRHCTLRLPCHGPPSSHYAGQWVSLPTNTSRKRLAW